MPRDVICIECRGRGFVVRGQRGRFVGFDPGMQTNPCYCSAGLGVNLRTASREQIDGLLKLILGA